MSINLANVWQQHHLDADSRCQPRAGLNEYKPRYKSTEAADDYRFID